MTSALALSCTTRLFYVCITKITKQSVPASGLIVFLFGTLKKKKIYIYIYIYIYIKS